MPQYMIGEDILITRSINQSAEASNAVRQALDAMLTISKHINLGEDIIKNINLLKEQYDSKKAKSVMQQVYEFDARLFFTVMDIISIKVAESSQVLQNKLFADYIAEVPDEVSGSETDQRPIFGGYVDEDEDTDSETDSSTDNSKEDEDSDV